MIVYPSAKINIGLLITEKREDNFHNIETVFYPVTGLQDALEIVRADDKTTLTLTGLPVEGDPDQNIVLKAYKMWKDRYDLPPVNIHLHKAIPMGAGLGGGSSDAVSLLKALNELFQLEVDREQLLQDALILGSDCPFFVDNIPAFGTGRGEVLTPVNLNLSDFTLIVIKPSNSVSTKEAYKHIRPQKTRISLKALIDFPVNRWQGNIQNQFEKYVFSSLPEVQNLKQLLYDNGASFALMSGSGSAVYGLFHSEKKGLEQKIPSDWQLFRQRLN